MVTLLVVNTIKLHSQGAILLIANDSEGDKRLHII